LRKRIFGQEKKKERNIKKGGEIKKVMNEGRKEMTK
jgi:hypothetical protein